MSKATSNQKNKIENLDEIMNEMQTLRVIPTTRQFSNQSFTQNNNP